MKHKRIFASILALASLTALTPLTAFAAEPTRITPENDPPTGITEVSYDVAAAYTVTIPAGVTLDDSTDGVAADITAENVMLPAGQKISVKLTGATNTKTEGATTFNAMAGESAVTYTIQNDDKPVALGDEVAALDKDNLTKQLAFVKDENAAPTFAGKHTEQLTFTIAVTGGAAVTTVSIPILSDSDSSTSGRSIDIDTSGAETWADIAINVPDDIFETALIAAQNRDSSSYEYTVNALYSNENAGVSYLNENGLYVLAYKSADMGYVGVGPGDKIDPELEYGFEVFFEYSATGGVG